LSPGPVKVFFAIFKNISNVPKQFSSILLTENGGNKE